MMKSTFAPTALLTFVLAAGAWGGEPEAAVKLVPLKVQALLVRTLAEKKVSSMPYTLSLNANDPRGSSLRMGIQVPLTIRGEGNQPSTVMFKDVGTNLDCRGESLEGGRYSLMFSVEQGSLASGDWSAISSTPVLRGFRSTSLLVLRDGQTERFVTATDPVTGEVLQIDVTLTVVK